MVYAITNLMLPERFAGDQRLRRIAAQLARVRS